METPLQSLVGHVLRKRPVDTSLPRPPHAVSGCGRAHPDASCNLTLGHNASFEPQHIAEVASFEACPFPVEKERANADSSATQWGPSHPRHRLVAIRRNGWSSSVGTTGHHQSETGGRHQPVRASHRSRNSRTVSWPPWSSLTGLRGSHPDL
jgi:hypothetical protein